MADRRVPRPTYEGARVEELEEPLLPRWFVLLALAAVPVAIGVGIWAFVGFGGGDIPIAARRPPPDPPLTTAVGQRNVGDLPPERVELPPACPYLDGITAAGTNADRSRIRAAVTAICELNVPGDIARRLQAFARVGGVVRFAQFEATGVDSTLDGSTDPPTVLVNARLARASTDPRWIAPLIVHDTTYLELEAGPAASALAAREAEDVVCRRLFDETRPSRACDDAAALLLLDDPLGALEAAGFSP